jgi:hypothetical protein
VRATKSAAILGEISAWKIPYHVRLEMVRKRRAIPGRLPVPALRLTGAFRLGIAFLLFMSGFLQFVAFWLREKLSLL